LYNYWRSAVTMHNKMLPDFGDQRAQGLAQMQSVEANGVFVRPMATLSLAFSWMEEGELEKSYAAIEKNKRVYPDNVINNLVGSMILVAMRRYEAAIATCDQIVATDPKNVRVHYWKGLALLKSNKLPEAKAELQGYLASDHLETEQQSYGHYRLGQVYAREQDYTQAIEQYKAAVKLDGHKGAKAAITALEERKKRGEITF
jgi:predicted Zn-dependent protease